MKVKTLCNMLKKLPGDHVVGFVVHRPDGDDFYEIEAKDLGFIELDEQGNLLPFKGVVLANFKGTVKGQK